ncbi:MAG TPA: MDR family MFS transporter [Stellaceae bacterium]|nr:MDR family MFS transporter [Stellaceae bacterium]
MASRNVPHPESSPAPIGISAANRRWVFAAALMTNFMAAIEVTIVATAMPTIVGDLGGFDLFSWVFTAYLLTQAVTIPIYGRLADIYGRKRLLYIGIALFLAGSVLCGFAWSMMSLIVFRVLQGLGAGAVMPVAQTLIGDIYRGADRARMQGYISTVFGSAAILGPIVGAVIVAHWSWSWVFWVNVPLGLASAVMLALTLHERVERHSHRIDYAGSALLALGTGVLMYALVEASSLGSGALVALLAASVALLAVFVLYESQAHEPLLPISLMRNPIIAYGNIASVVSGAAIMGITAFLPAYMQVAMGQSVLAGGYALMAMSGAWPVGGFTAGRVAMAFSYRAAVVGGGVVLVIGSLLMIALDPSRGVAWAVASTLLMGYGFGLANNTWGVAVQANVEWTERGVATSSIVFSRIIGQALGTAIFGGIVNAGLARHIAGAGDLVNRMLEPALRAEIPSELVGPVMADFAAALHRVYVINGFLALIVLASALGMPRGLTPQGSSSRS